ncbi:MAG: hypothetical protein LKJ57_05320, partial [Ancrocorticia sp.]|jgi:hypothetical protein|nr:hypothetical protein [Ancrocorticia sp.]MCI2192566.1 hypothetical protein [Ancrocorticia sp.]
MALANVPGADVRKSDGLLEYIVHKVRLIGSKVHAIWFEGPRDHCCAVWARASPNTTAFRASFREEFLVSGDTPIEDFPNGGSAGNDGR